MMMTSQVDSTSSKIENPGSAVGGNGPRTLVYFTSYNKMSPSLVELRIDYHLNRIMKSYRLNNFANAIKALPLQSRICEKLIEILTSSENLIDRKLNKVKEGKVMLERLYVLGQSITSRGDLAVKDELSSPDFWPHFKFLAGAIEQITWALNSNKEHLRYIARVHVLPTVYKRSDEEHIRLKELVVKVVEDCQEVIDICRTIRHAFEIQLRTIYGTVCPPQLMSITNDQVVDQKKMEQKEQSEPSSVSDMNATLFFSSNEEGSSISNSSTTSSFSTTEENSIDSV